MTVQERDCTQLPRFDLYQTAERGSDAITVIRLKRRVDVRGQYVHASLTSERASSRFRPARNDKPLWTDGWRILNCREEHKNINRGLGYVSPTLDCQVSPIILIADAGTLYMSAKICLIFTGVGSPTLRTIIRLALIGTCMIIWTFEQARVMHRPHGISSNVYLVYEVKLQLQAPKRSLG